MALQIRLTHSLGDRLIDLVAAPADSPVVVGRSAGAGVQVPSANISKQHCLLFVHDGRWCIQDGGSTAGTYLNGERVVDAAFLNSGDVIALGNTSTAPTITIDPHGVGVTEREEEESAAAVPAPQARGGYAASSLPQPMARPVTAQGYAGGAVSGAFTSQDIGAGDEVAGADPFGGLSAEAGTGWDAAQSRATSRAPRRKQGNTAVTVGVVVTVSIAAVAAAGYIVYRAQQNMKEEQTVVIIKKGPEAPKAGPKSIFEDGPRVDDGKVKVKPGVGGGATTSKPVKATAANSGGANSGEGDQMAQDKEPPVDPRKQDERWQGVEQARFEKPQDAINKFNDYRANVPDTPFTKELDEYTAEAVDRLWWMRIAELIADRDDAQKEIASRKTDLAQSSDPEFKKGLEAEIKTFESKFAAANETLRTQMKFTGNEPPNVYDSANLAALRKTRDAEAFKTWSEEVLNSIRRSHGTKLPWRSSR